MNVIVSLVRIPETTPGAPRLGGAQRKENASNEKAKNRSFVPKTDF
jgi:hypothetical protein